MNRKNERQAVDKKESQLITRRNFLKNAGGIAGGIAITSQLFMSACSSPSRESTSISTTNTSVTTTTTTSSTSATKIAPTLVSTSLPPAEGFVYKTPLEQPPMMEIPGCTTCTATDRKYIVEHMWVKMVAENIVAIGITEKMAELTAVIYSLSLPPKGSILRKGDFFAYAEAAKMNVEFLAPVSGTVLQINNSIFFDLGASVNESPYLNGWFCTVQLSNPEEWDDLLTPQEYTDLNAKVQ